MIELFHFGNAICAQKVRICLAEKGIEWKSYEVSPQDLRSEKYLKINPKGVVPSLRHKGRTLVESRLLSEYIEDEFDGPALLPDNAIGRYQSQLWSKQVDDSLHLNIFILSFACSMREKFLAMPTNKLELALPGLTDPVKRLVSWDVLENGYESKYVSVAVDRMNKLTSDMEAVLMNNLWLAGDSYSLADADLTPYAKRIEDVGLSYLFLSKPHLQNWIVQTRERASYQSAILNWLNDNDNERISLGRESAEKHYQSLNLSDNYS